MDSHIDISSIQEDPSFSSPVESSPSASVISATAPIVCDPANRIHAPGTLCICADRRVRLSRATETST
jgi:hypothetical protein